MMKKIVVALLSDALLLGGVLAILLSILMVV